ncbi:hypothetical protein I601_3088 [Nocardioides dokdonensis FR1436]|uniref:Uncharacterized protein n=2 Tax=Nocardioides TaxID=1839 RepID=A0A1A9GN41_9ACTN|nr:hypothetical protein I601_3088 [Nocardioides dokdonensis FR1436]
MPSADDLFRPTAPAAPPEAPQGDGSTPPAAGEPARKRPSGRVRHDEKMTVYITSDELLAVEQARLTLRSAHALAIDRGRLVREALALALADLEERGEDSALVRRLVEE